MKQLMLGGCAIMAAGALAVQGTRSVSPVKPVINGESTPLPSRLRMAYEPFKAMASQITSLDSSQTVAIQTRSVLFHTLIRSRSSQPFRPTPAPAGELCLASPSTESHLTPAQLSSGTMIFAFTTKRCREGLGDVSARMTASRMSSRMAVTTITACRLRF